jgi:hypothetical protein
METSVRKSLGKQSFERSRICVHNQVRLCEAGNLIEVV